MEVAVEKNQRIKMFGLNSTESHDTDDDIFGGGDGQGPTNEKSVPPGPTFTHKLPQMLKIAIIGINIQAFLGLGLLSSNHIHCLVHF